MEPSNSIKRMKTWSCDNKPQVMKLQREVENELLMDIYPMDAKRQNFNQEYINAEKERHFIGASKKDNNKTTR